MTRWARVLAKAEIHERSWFDMSRKKTILGSRTGSGRQAVAKKALIGWVGLYFINMEGQLSIFFFNQDILTPSNMGFCYWLV